MHISDVASKATLNYNNFLHFSQVYSLKPSPFYCRISSMLGYVTIAKDELKIKEYDIYQGYYCGICKSIGRRYGQLPRSFLSYDAVFLALITEALIEDKELINQQHCIVHPFTKKNVMMNSQAVDYAADVMVLLAYHKCADDWHDDRDIKAMMGKFALAGAYGKLKDRYKHLTAAVENGLTQLSKLEKEKSGNLDLTCDTFGRIMEALFTGFVYGSSEHESEYINLSQRKYSAAEDSSEKNNKNNISREKEAEVKRVLGVLGSSLGKWIYAIDALDDFEEDVESGAYNPFIYRKGGLEGIEELLYNYLAQVAGAWDLLDVKKNAGLIENIIYLGLRLRTDVVLGKYDVKGASYE